MDPIPEAPLHLAVLALSGGAGCALRVAVRDMLVRAGVPAWSTIAAVNAVGALAIGALSGMAVESGRGTLGSVATIGMLGGWTTYSAFAWDTVRLWSSGSRRAAVALWAVTVAGCPVLAIAGHAAVRSVPGAVP